MFLGNFWDKLNLVNFGCHFCRKFILNLIATLLQEIFGKTFKFCLGRFRKENFHYESFFSTSL